MSARALSGVRCRPATRTRSTPSERHKIQAEGVGNLATTNPDGEYATLTRIIVEGGRGNDRLQGHAGGDTMFGRAGNDRMKGGGGKGGDRLQGDAGFDRLAGDRGDDRLRGGRDGDTFVFRNLNDGRVDLDANLDCRRAQTDVIKARGGRHCGPDFRQRRVGLTLNGNRRIIDQLLFA